MTPRLEAAPWTKAELELTARVYLDLLEREHCAGVTRRWETLRTVELYLRAQVGLPGDARKETPACTRFDAWLASRGRVSMADVRAWFGEQGYESEGETARFHLRRLERERKVWWLRGRGRSAGTVHWLGGAV